jgi:hypothetical protein
MALAKLTPKISKPALNRAIKRKLKTGKANNEHYSSSNFDYFSVRN